uniref:Putative secreted protein n=1 Tax=Anopheles darlingi TaxID=43151 RepID=A0A2M4D5Z9_ANODA
MASKVHIASAFGCVLVLILLPLIFQVLWAVARAFRLLSPSSSMVSIMCYPATAVRFLAPITKHRSSACSL